MGSSGSYSANVTVSFSYAQKEKNEDIDLLNKLVNSNKYTKEIILKRENIQDSFGIRIIHVETEERSFKSNEYKTLDDFLEAIEDIEDEDPLSIFILKRVEIEDLEYINLNITEKYRIYKLTEDCIHSKQILSCGESLYCDCSNESKDEKEVSQIMELLSLPKSKLVLFGSGDIY